MFILRDSNNYLIAKGAIIYIIIVWYFGDKEKLF
jgi:hypothetical protein